MYEAYELLWSRSRHKSQPSIVVQRDVFFEPSERTWLFGFGPQCGRQLYSARRQSYAPILVHLEIKMLSIRLLDVEPLNRISFQDKVEGQGLVDGAQFRVAAGYV